MRLIISESKRFGIAKKWLTKNYGNLEKFESDKQANEIFYMKDGEVILEYNRENGRCYISYKEIWSVLESVFQLESLEIKEITKEWLEEHYKLRVMKTRLK